MIPDVLRYVVNNTGCYICTSHAKDSCGYHQLRYQGKRNKAHRLVYELNNGPLTSEQVVRHKCDNSSCINPDHLEIGTHADNVLDRVSRGRSAKGTRSGKAKLSEDDVVKIRLSPLSPTELSRIYSVGPEYITKVRKGKTWNHIRD